MATMDLFLQLDTWVALLTLVFLEIVLGIDNIIFISIVSNKLPENQQERARKTGLVLAMLMRIVLLMGISFIIKMKEPLFTINLLDFYHEVSLRDLILLVGGLFLLAKSTSEIHEKMVEAGDKHQERKASTSLSKVIFQIIMLDIVFSFDSILTAVGLSDEILIMVLAVVISLLIMIAYSNRISAFINTQPTLQILALSFLILIAVMLVLDAFHHEIPKGYIYFAVFFSLLVEVVNIRLRKRATR